MAEETFLQSPFVLELVLPFLLMFTIVFAILQKTEIFGKGKKQIDALVSLSVALIFLAFGHAVDVVSYMIPFLAVSLVVVLVFMLLIGFFYKPGEMTFEREIKIGAGIVFGIATLIALLVATGAWDYLYKMFNAGEGSLVYTIILIVVIVAAIGTILSFSGKDK